LTNRKALLIRVSPNKVTLCVAIEKGEDCLNSRIYQHKFREDRDRNKDISPKKFNPSNFKTQGDRLKIAMDDAEGWIFSKEPFI
jgi:hypothetical protein